jgi:hyperosmotically inducible protein
LRLYLWLLPEQKQSVLWRLSRAIAAWKFSAALALNDPGIKHSSSIVCTENIMKKISLATLAAFATLSATLSLPSWANDTATHESGSKLSRTATSASQFVDDVAITTSVKARLVADEVTKARDIKVTTHNGVVQLTGDVDSSRERRKAEAIASSVDGVQYIKNELKLKMP